MARQNSGAKQVAALAKAVGKAFVAARLPVEVMAQPIIRHTTAPWQLPPLKSSLVWQGVPMQDYLDVSMGTDENRLFTFWNNTMKTLATAPTAAMRNKLYIGLRSAAPGERAGSKRYTFSVPYGFPHNLDDNVGLIFSLEAAHLAITSLPLADVVDHNDSYYAVTLSGYQIGVKNGRALHRSCSADGSGSIRDLLELPRGEVTSSCAYDTIALARSLLIEHKSRFGADYAPVDLALQALRALTLDRHCPELVRVLGNTVSDSEDLVQKRKILTYCLEVMATTMPDRNKIAVLRSELIGNIVTATTFKREIYYTDAVPAVLAEARYRQIVDWLNNKLSEVNYAE